MLLEEHNLPPPFNHEALVQDQSINDAKAPHALRSTNQVPLNHPIFALIISGILIESTSMLVKTRMGPSREKVKDH